MIRWVWLPTFGITADGMDSILQKAISPVPPQYYGERFLRFMISIQRGNASVQETIEQEKKGEKAE